jgi:hypothetical protein
MDWTLQNKALKNMLRLVLTVLIFTVTYQLWTGPLGELMLRFRVSPYPELFKKPPGKLAIHDFKSSDGFRTDSAAPTIVWTDSTTRAKRWLICVESADNQKLTTTVTGKPEWKPGERVWTKMKEIGRDQDVRISVFGVKGFTILSGSSVTIRTQSDKL